MVIVRWIGYHVELQRKEQSFKMKPIDGASKVFASGRDESYQFDIYGLTYEGRAVCVEDYCVKLANNESTHVIMFQDRN